MESQIIQILQQIKSSKKYKTLSDEIILKEINSYLKSNPKKSVSKFMLKEIKTKLHRMYSSYQTSKKCKREKYLNELKQNPKNIYIIQDILSTNISTKERLEDYESLYQEIFSITRKPKTIVDLGCGLNPISFPYMNLTSVNYHAYDIDESDINFLNEFFKIEKIIIQGNAEILDINNESSINKIPNSDIVFLFKIIDIIDINNHKPSEELIKSLIKKTKFIVASFAIKTIAGNQMNFPKRKWFELMLNRLGIEFHIIKKRNEIYYILHQ
jgi:16S rRNA (guanine(1405)-N(7))-methyltransferase